MFIETVIVGCGPSGIQLGYFLKQTNNEYIILEKSDSPGSFFHKYPHSKELISINKLYTGKSNKEFNLRHDWNSLLNNFELQMSEISDKYYPSRDDLVQYLSLFVLKHKLNVKYNINVTHISKKDDLFTIICNANQIWTCKKLIIATGLSKPNIPYIKNIEKYTQHYGDFPTDYFLNDINLNKYKNTNLLILGQGNSAFELANILTSFCANIVILGRNHGPIPSFVTHYVGDLRSKYLNFYDTFLLKSLNAFDTIKNNTQLTISLHKDKLLYLEQTCEDTLCTDCTPSSYFREPNIGFHNIINCTGWVFDDSIFDDSIKPILDNKFPKIKSNYESDNVDNLYFIGSLMHSLDYKKSSGGFIHGFRYLIDNFVKINYSNFTSITFTDINELSTHFYKRINLSSGLYQMHGQLCDFFYKLDDKFVYYEQIPLSYLFTYKNTKINIPKNFFFILTLEYGFKSETDIKLIGQSTTHIGAESKALLLHPILRIFDNRRNDFNFDDYFYPSYGNIVLHSNLKDTIHFDEDLLSNFTNKQIYLEKFYRIMYSYMCF